MAPQDGVKQKNADATKGASTECTEPHPPDVPTALDNHLQGKRNEHDYVYLIILSRSDEPINGDGKQRVVEKQPVPRGKQNLDDFQMS